MRDYTRMDIFGTAQFYFYTILELLGGYRLVFPLFHSETIIFFTFWLPIQWTVWNFGLYSFSKENSGFYLGGDRLVYCFDNRRQFNARKFR